MDNYSLTSGVKCKPTNNQRAIDACPSIICACYMLYKRELEDVASESLQPLIQLEALLMSSQAENKRLREALRNTFNLVGGIQLITGDLPPYNQREVNGLLFIAERTQEAASKALSQPTPTTGLLELAVKVSKMLRNYGKFYVADDYVADLLGDVSYHYDEELPPEVRKMLEDWR